MYPHVIYEKLSLKYFTKSKWYISHFQLFAFPCTQCIHVYVCVCDSDCQEKFFVDFNFILLWILFNMYQIKSIGQLLKNWPLNLNSSNINNLRYADYTTLMAESEEELKNLLRKVKEESEKVGLKLNIQKTNIMASIFKENSGNSGWLYFGGLQNHCGWWLQPWN